MYKRKTRGWSQHFDFMAWDILLLELSLTFSFIFRGGFQFTQESELFWTLLVILPFVDLAIIVVMDSYHSVIRRDSFHELVGTLNQSVYLALFLGGYLILTKQDTVVARFVFFTTMLLYIMTCFIMRVLWKDHLQRRLHIKNHVGLLVVAHVSRLHQLLTSLINQNYNSYRFVGVGLLDEDATAEEGEAELRNIWQGDHQIENLRVVALRDNLLNYLVNNWVDEVFLDITSGEELPIDLINKIMGMGITVHSALTSIDRIEARNKNIEWICGQATITTSLGYVSGRDLLLKRMIDIVGGLIGSLFTLLLTLVLGPMIYIASPGPIFFHQIRIGENGRKFKMYKFRSMYLDAEKRKKELQEEQGQENDLMFKMEHDPRIIGSKLLPDGTWKKGIGGWIRDLSLDEFPQFFNVLKGDMSLVGTRPPTVDEWEHYKPYHRGRMSTKPGLTGMWQISGRSKIRDFDKVVQLDREYIENWSLRLDFEIMLRTVWVVITRRGAM